MTQAKKLCAISVDLDPLTSYYQIHGLGEPPAQLRSTIMKRVLPRFEELFAEAEVPATFFIVGQELEISPDAQEILARMIEAGHELGNHTYGHPYDLCRLEADRIAEEIGRAHQVVVDRIGAKAAPVGFRSPGYFINGRVLEVLTSLGYRYDSSMFPSPPYWLAKVAVMATMAMRGRHSASVITDPRGLTGPADPYRPDPDRPWRRGHADLVELPVAVMPNWRVPVIGTLFAAGPSWLRSAALRSISQRRFFNFELHGIDLADAVDDSIPTALAGRQPDLRIPFDAKRKTFLETITQLKADYRFVTLRGAAEQLADHV